jgi:hypothetical protein
MENKNKLSTYWRKRDKKKTYVLCFKCSNPVLGKSRKKENICILCASGISLLGRVEEEEKKKKKTEEVKPPPIEPTGFWNKVKYFIIKLFK